MILTFCNFMDINVQYIMIKITFISSTESIATPAIPTSPGTRGLSESYLYNGYDTYI